MKAVEPTILNEITQLSTNALGVIDTMIRSSANSDIYGGNVAEAHRHLQDAMGPSPDVVYRYITVPALPDQPILLTYITGITDSQIVDTEVVAPLLLTSTPADQWRDTTLFAGHVTKRHHWSGILQDLASGNLLIFAPGLAFVWSVDTAQFPKRSIGRPQTEQSVRGPQQAFTEDIYTQMSQIRRNFFDPRLQFHEVTFGRLQNSPVMITVIDGLTNPALIAVVKKRLNAIRIDGRPTASLVGGLIRDHPRSIFPTIRSTERVDVACKALLDGRVVICMEGDPFVLIAPAPLIDFYRTAMDYADGWYDTSFIRVIRLLGWAIGVYLPAFYIALTEVNTNFVPPALLIVTAGSHAGLPFSPLVEAILMILVIEVLREAALRLPKALSTTIGTVGGIVVGTAVIKAGLVSPQMIVVITLTALSFYSVPVYELTGSWRFVDFLMLMAAAVVGVYGIVLVTVWVIGTLIALDSFGVPYFAPFAPLRMKDWNDVLWRVPWDLLRHRPSTPHPTPLRQIGDPSSSVPPHLRKMRS